MKKYFIFEHCDNIIMVDVANLTVSDRVCFYNAILKKNEFMHDIEFGSFVKVLKYYAYGENVSVTYTPLPTGGFKYERIFKSDKPRVDTSIETSKRIPCVHESHSFIEFEDENVAELWAESVKDEYSERGSRW